ncbi:TRAP transporter permease [Peribacillus sp. NPDC097264]|uniref:TRAP transporter permease n=1 Tax=Peribacillus sp. NPDC097264 TaxID=3390616 RepID=UPI003D088478
MKNILKIRYYLSWVASLTISVFLFYTAGFGQMSPMIQRVFPLLLVCVITFCAFPLVKSKEKTKKWHYILDAIFLFFSTFSLLYVMFNENEIALRIGGATTNTDFIVSLIGTIVVIELCRRTTSALLAGLSILFLVYVFFGPYFPGMFGHSGFNLETTSIYMFLGQDGIFGSALSSMVTFIFIFILFGAVLEITGAGKYMIDLALAITGRMTGGPAITAILASSLFGSMSGSPVANVSGTGTLTIPLMKKTGFSANYAGAVEAVASTGGQFMPPIMGSAAFLMAEMLGMAYIDIAISAIIPALLYYLCLYLSVYLKARKNGFVGLPKEELPKIRNVIKEGGHVLLPILVLVYLLVAGFSPGYSAFYTIIATVILSLIKKSTRKPFKDYVESFVSAARQSVPIFSALACVGIIVGSISLTGLGVKFSILVVAAAGQSLLLALIFVALACIVLGMGLPPIAGYLLVVVIAGSAVAELGANLFAAHMFIFFFASSAVITPPVALAAFVAAGISGGNAMKTGFIAVRLGIVAFIIPFMFVFSPELLLIGNNAMDTVLAVVSAVLGVSLLSVSMEGFVITKVPIWLRIVGMMGGLLLIIPGVTTDVIGLVLLLSVFIQQLAWSRLKDKEITPISKSEYF